METYTTQKLSIGLNGEKTRFIIPYHGIKTKNNFFEIFPVESGPFSWSLKVSQYVTDDSVRPWVSVFLTLDTKLFTKIDVGLNCFYEITLTSVVDNTNKPVVYGEYVYFSNDDLSCGTNKFIRYDDYKKYVEKGTFTLDVKISFWTYFIMYPNETHDSFYKQILIKNNFKNEEAVFHHFLKLYNKQQDFNFQIYSNDGIAFWVHKELLSVVSPFFEALLSGKYSEQKNIKIEKANQQTLKTFIHYIYTKKIKINDINDLFELIEFSDFLCVENFTESLKMYIFSLLGSTENAVHIMDWVESIDISCQKEILTKCTQQLQKSKINNVISLLIQQRQKFGQIIREKDEIIEKLQNELDTLKSQ
eukprot:gene12591-6411_t